MKIKEIIGFVLSVVIMVITSVSAFAVSAAEGYKKFVYEDWEYVYEDWEYVYYNGSVTNSYMDTVAISAYRGNDKNVVVPDNIIGYKVVAIFDEVFMDNDTVESIIIPESVICIHRDNFEDCKYLKKVYVPQSVRRVDERCFIRCSADLEICGNIDSYIYTYANKSGIAFTEYDGKQTSSSDLYKYEFTSGDFKYTYYEDCGYWDGGWFVTDEEQDNIAITAYIGTEENVTIPEIIDGKTVCGIFDEVFMDKNTIKSVRLPNTIKRIHRDNFENCSNLEKIYLSQSVDRIDESCFCECPQLSTIYGPTNSFVWEYFRDNMQYTFVICDDSETEYPEVPGKSDLPTVEVESGKTMPGQTIEVNIYLKNNQGFSNLGIEIGYNSDVMSIIEVVPNDEINSNFTQAQSLNLNPFNLSWDSISNNTFNGKLVALKFKINEDAAIGEYPITIDFYKGIDGQYKDGEDVNYDENEKAIKLSYKSSVLSVDDYIPGDINGDTKINSRDAVALLRYLAKWNMSDVNTSALDTNGDGKINNKDATLLLRYIAGWDVELK